MSASQAGPLWSPQQREWLQALGHPPLTLVSRDAPVDAGSPRAEKGAEESPPQPQPASNTAYAPQAPVEPRPVVDGLHRALLRAIGLPAADAELALQALGVDAAALRGDPAAKRRLWTRLRQLRRSRPT